MNNVEMAFLLVFHYTVHRTKNQHVDINKGGYYLAKEVYEDEIRYLIGDGTRLSSREDTIHTAL
jgi:hypothetical protein